ncbi:MAG: acyl carrier protein [Janthinobacterium lividum]
MEEKIRDFIEETFLVKFGVDLDPQTDFFKAGLIDSFGYVQLINFIESEFTVKYDEEEMLTQIFTTYASLIRSVRGKLDTAS